eukprot:c29031_g1_i1 orf=390-1727(-)
MAGPLPEEEEEEGVCCAKCRTTALRGNDRVSRPGCAEREMADIWQRSNDMPPSTGVFSRKQNSPQKPLRKRNASPTLSPSNFEEEVAENATRASSSPASGRKPRNCNLDRFLESTCPSVQPLYLPKSCQWEACQSRLQLGHTEPLPYFALADLRDSFGEWSAYGAGVPITLNGNETVVQYYAPYLSAMQLYTARSGQRPFLKFRHPNGDSDASDYSCSEVSSDGESDRLPECWKCECGKTHKRDAGECCICDAFKKDRNIPRYRIPEGDGWDWHGHLLFEYFEESPPHGRVPLADKITELARVFPELRSLRSVDLLPASWMSVAWYPIYRIPTGPTLRDLAACFLTYHCLSTSWQDGALSGIVEPSKSPAACSVSLLSDRHLPRIYLQAFGLAHYKLRGSIWTSVGNQERRHASSLFRCAESWLRCLGVRHPDFEFFISHNPTSR